MYTKVILKTRELIQNSEIIFSDHLSSKRAFKRCKKLRLPIMIVLIMKCLNRSLQIELTDCFIQLEELDDLPSKSSFSQSRYKIEVGLFKLFNKRLCDLGKSTINRKFPYGKLRRVAVDGSTLDLPQTKELDAIFGHHKNQHGKRTQGRFCFAQDIDQDEILQASLASCKVSEKAIALPFLAHFGPTDVLIYDQYYYGLSLIHI